MTITDVSFSPEAARHIADLHEYIAAASSRERATEFIDALTDYCDGLKIFPLRGVRRDDIRQGVRTTSFRRRAAIVFEVSQTMILILGVYYGGREINPDAL